MNKQTILKEKFGYSSFRTGQEEVINAILAGKNVLAIMPTGAGKSLCYQIPALLLNGMTIVISPLISLMKDQVSALRETGCEAALLNSSLTNDEYAKTMNSIMRGNVKLLYIAPERLQRNEIPEFSANINIPLVVVDEAHCVSQWGHDFRTSYLQIANFINTLESKPVTAAFTATATVKVREDICRLLALGDPFTVNTGFDRPNLYFEVQKPSDKKTALIGCLERRKNLSGIIYCSTRKTVEETCILLNRRGFNATRYHAGLDDSERRQNQDDFIYDRKLIMVATNAFGMGINKSNVSFVIHYNMPKNIESYYQEAGRAGRDGSPSDCILLYSGQDVRINEYLIRYGDDSESDYNSAAEALQTHNLELLKQMTYYSASSDCLRRRLLSYFGERAPSNCGNCGNCLTEYEEIDVTIEAQKIVSCVYRLKQRSRSFGKTMIIDILRGSKNEKIRRFELESLSTYGVMGETSAQRIRVILDHLIDKGFLVLEEGEFPVVSLGNYAALLREEKTVMMKLPDERKKTPSEKYLPEEKSVSIKSNNTKSENSEIEIDNALLEKLKKLRKEIAARETVPAYIVFSDAALQDMCRKRPLSSVQFSQVNGVGSVKLKKYGDMFVSLIKEYYK